MTDFALKVKTLADRREKVEKSRNTGQILYFCLSVIEILLIFRLVFKFTEANPGNIFVSLIYLLTQIFVVPFIGIYPQSLSSLTEVTSVLEPAALLAVVVYAVLVWGITQIVMILSGRSR